MKRHFFIFAKSKDIKEKLGKFCKKVVQVFIIFPMGEFSFLFVNTLAFKGTGTRD